MSSIRTDPVALDTNEFIFALLDLISGARQVDWGYEPTGDTLLGHYLRLGAKKGDARICAQLHAAGVRWLISENRHFLGGIPHLPFTVLSAADALVELG